MNNRDRELAERDWSDEDDDTKDWSDEQLAEMIRQIDWARTQADTLERIASGSYDIPRWWPA